MGDESKGQTRRDELQLRPHHVLGLLDFFRNPSVNHYIEFRRKKGFFHSDELVNYWIRTISSLIENYRSTFRYVSSIDSICNKCQHRANCNNPKHKNYTIVESFDQCATRDMPGLIIGNKYDSKFIHNLFKKKGWL